jgi:hypothetical protein
LSGNEFFPSLLALVLKLPILDPARERWLPGSAPGCDVVAADRSVKSYEANLPHLTVDFNQNDFAPLLGLRGFVLVNAIEVIEHVESPIGFLRNIGRMLSLRGVAVITTPNVDSLPARLKFLLFGKIRTMDALANPLPSSLIFSSASFCHWQASSIRC